MKRVTRLARNLKPGDVFRVRDTTGDRFRSGKVRVINVIPAGRGFLTNEPRVQVNVERLSGGSLFLWPEGCVVFYGDEKVDIEREESGVLA